MYRKREKYERYASAPFAPETVALETDVGAHEHRHERRYAAEEKPDDDVGSPQVLELERKDARHDCFHQSDGKVAP